MATRDMRKRKRAMSIEDDVVDLAQDAPPTGEASRIGNLKGAAQRPAGKSTKKNSKPFRLLDLPAELRNNIYEKVLEDSTVTLRRSPKQRKTKKGNKIKPQWQDSIEVSSPLAQLNRQVRSEFYHMAMVSADIHTLVIDFDFGHVITFLNRLSEVELNKMGSEDEEEGPERLFKITLKHTDQCIYSRPQLRRWLNRMNVTAKKGTSIDYRYTFMPGEAYKPPSPMSLARLTVSREQILGVIQNAGLHHVRNHTGSRAAVEATKIGSAASRGLR